METKKKKKQQLHQQLLPPEEAAKLEAVGQKEKEEQTGSTQYITDHRFDKILKRYREDIKAEVAEHHMSKKQIIIRTAQELEKDGYPLNQICDRISKSSKGLGYGDRYVRKCLDDKYKNPFKAAEASNQSASTVAVQRFHDQQELRKKELKHYTIDDIKAASITQLRKLCKAHMEKGDFWKRLADQKDEKIKELNEQVKRWEAKAKQIAVQDKKNTEDFYKLCDLLQLHKLSDEELGKECRRMLTDFRKQQIELRKEGKDENKTK